MDRQYIDDNHIIARYLADRLSDEEREAFEAYYLEHPEIVKEMETTARFKAGLGELRRSGELDALVRGRPRVLNLRYLAAAAAAAVAAVAIGVAFYVNRSTSVGPLLAATPALLQANGGLQLRVTSTHQIMRTRSTAADAIVPLPATAQAIELEILPETAGPPASYRVSLARVDGNQEQQLAQIERLSANESGFVEVYLDSRGLRPGRYVVKLTSATSADAPTSVFSLRVEAAAQ